jgi:hypothetical protein
VDAEGRRCAVGDARRTGARRHGATAPGLKRFAKYYFEINLLQKFE